jgi:hypothetical protein
VVIHPTKGQPVLKWFFRYKLIKGVINMVKGRQRGGAGGR